MRNRWTGSVLALLALGGSALAADPAYDYRVLATNKTGTMEKEMNEAAAAGYRFDSVMGGETLAGKEVVTIMVKAGASADPVSYKLLATSKTSTMEKELKDAGAEGFLYRGQTVFPTTFGGREVTVILERDPAGGAKRFDYRLLATKKTSTMDKELNEAGAAGFKLVGMSVSKTALGGEELVSILLRELE